MLDGILNRGFSSKCKSLIKATRTRIEVVRRRAEAKQRFLKEDLAKLLDNGLDINAFGRTEEILLGQSLLSCYDFVEQSCEYIVKQLSYMQKLRDCPEDCREAVASLMFAAARFSDLPELRELRDLFQERYGNYLECFVNQKFVEKLSSRPPAMEKRIQLLQDIALEFSIRWDSMGFQQRMVLAQAKPNRSGSSHSSTGNHILPNGKGGGSKTDKLDVAIGERHKGFNDQHNIQNGRDGIVLKKEQQDLHSSETKESSMHGNKLLYKQEGSYSKGRKCDMLFDKEVEQTRTRNKAVLEKDDYSSETKESSYSKGRKHDMLFDKEVEQTRTRNKAVLEKDDNSSETKESSMHGNKSLIKQEASYTKGRKHDMLFDKEVEQTRTRNKAVLEKDDNSIKKAKSGSSSHGERLESFDNKFTRYNETHGQILMERSESRGLPFKTDDASSAWNTAIEKNTVISTGMVQQENGNRLTSYANLALPPPYIKSKEKAVPPPYVKPSDSKERARHGSKQSASEFDGHFRSTSPRNKLDTNKTNKESEFPDHEAETIKPPVLNSHCHEKEFSHKDGLTLPKPRSVRRKHHKSVSNRGEEGKSEDIRVVKKSSSSRRREHSRKGLQILFEDESHQKDDEERMIDNLLLHYSKKPSKCDVGTLRKKPQAHHSLLTTPDTGESSNGQTNRDHHEMGSDMLPFPKRSISLPHEQTAPSEATKVFARANSFQPDNQACHVHPKLPDYDDLTARFAALRGR